MTRQTGRAVLVLSGEHRSTLSERADSRTAAQREVERVKALSSRSALWTDAW